MKEIKTQFLNPVKNRFLPLPRNATEGLEHEPSIKDFDIIKQLGRGSFGQVHLASHKKTKAQYAIKSINKNLPENLEEKASFNREVEIMYKLDHPNIVKLYGHFEDNDFCYFLMQYIPKRSVFELITHPGQKPNLKLIASVMKDLLSAVYYLHNMKPVIMHRDIKPENILLDENNKAYLTDFGWSNYIRNDRRRNTVCGTPLYLPPEMVGEFGHDETADIWCIGVLLFELITGKCPFAGNDFETVKYNISRLNISWPNAMDQDAKDLTSKILKIKGKDRLSIEQILSHKFFAKYFPNAVNELIKPEVQNNKIFIISTDNPKAWNQQKYPSSNSIINNISNKSNASNNNINNRINAKNLNDVTKNNVINLSDKYKKISVVNQKREEKEVKNRGLYVPKANIDLYKVTKNEKNKNNEINIKYNINPISNYRKNNNSHKMTHRYTTSNINKSYTSFPNSQLSSYKIISSTNNNENSNLKNKSNIYRNSYKVSSNSKVSNYNCYNNDKFRNNDKTLDSKQDNIITNKANYNSSITTSNKRYNNTNVNSILNNNKNNINISNNNYRKSYRSENKNTFYSNYSSYNNKK